MAAPGATSDAAAAGAQAGRAALPVGQAVRLDQLPPEVLQRILATIKLASTSTLTQLAAVSRGFRRALQGPSCMWHSLQLGWSYTGRARTPAELLSLARWLRARCAQTTSLTLELTRDDQLESVIALLAPGLEYAALSGGDRVNLRQAAVDQLVLYGTNRLTALELTRLAPGVQLDHLSALAGLRTLTVDFARVHARASVPAAAMEPFPAALCRLGQLTKLDLTYPHLQRLPNALSRLTALRRLSVQTNASLLQETRRLPAVAVEQGVAHMRSLEGLAVEGCRLPADWPSLSGLTALTWLAFTHCACSGGGLPAGCCAAPALKELSCTFVEPCHLPPGGLTALESLTLESCELHEFPAAACQLRSLTYLNLAYNKFATVPRSISQLTSLVHLDLSSEDAGDRLTADELAAGDARSLSCRWSCLSWANCERWSFSAPPSRLSRAWAKAWQRCTACIVCGCPARCPPSVACARCCCWRHAWMHKGALTRSWNWSDRAVGRIYGC